MSKAKAAAISDAAKVDAAVAYLRLARDLFVDAGAYRSADKTRAAIISAGGAQKHRKIQLSKFIANDD